MKAVIALVFVLIPLSALAQETPTPTVTATATIAVTATVTPLPTGAATATATAVPAATACADLNLCVNAAVPTAVAVCAASNPSCQARSNDRYALTARELADRTVNYRRCRRLAGRASCNGCYTSARALLTSRYDSRLFRGLLGYASSLVEQERRTTCVRSR